MPTAKPTYHTIAIIGVGLIGGSIGMAVRQRKLANKVIGIGRRQASLDKAIACGAIDTSATDIATGVADAQLIIVCTPVDQIVAHAREATVACPARALITDAGSTKRAIVELLDDIRFVGSHPLAGSEKTGCENGNANLFVNRACVITPTETTATEDEQAITAFWQSLGMNTLRMTPSAHDAALATTSHLPHVVAAALSSATPDDYLQLVAGGWLDTTRIAAADEQLWRQILLDNRANVLQSLDTFQASLDALRAAITDGETARLEQLLREGRQRREAAVNRD